MHGFQSNSVESCRKSSLNGWLVARVGRGRIRGDAVTGKIDPSDGGVEGW